MNSIAPSQPLVLSRSSALALARDLEARTGLTVRVALAATDGRAEWSFEMPAEDGYTFSLESVRGYLRCAKLLAKRGPVELVMVESGNLFAVTPEGVFSISYLDGLLSVATEEEAAAVRARRG